MNHVISLAIALALRLDMATSGGCNRPHVSSGGRPSFSLVYDTTSSELSPQSNFWVGYLW